MRIALEYAERVGYLQKLLLVPFSLFLESLWDDLKHVVITVNQDEKPDCFLIKRWDISNIDIKLSLPPHVESAVSKNELFSSDDVILEDHYTLDYVFEDYEYLPPPDNASIEWMQAEQENYRASMRKFFFSESHQNKRHELLWHHFANGMIAEAYKELKGLGIHMQQSIVEDLAPHVWQTWMLWRENLLDFPANVAPELVFLSHYERKVKLNADFQQHLMKPVFSSITGDACFC